MSGSDWGDGLTAFLVACVVAWAVIASVLVLERYEGKPCPANPDACEDYKKSKEIRPLGSSGKTEEEKHAAYQNEYRSEQDLIAQQNMASWTWWVMLANWLSLLALIATVLFAWSAAYWAAAAANAGHEMNELAERSLVAENRPWIVAELKQASVRSFTGSSFPSYLELSLSNCGKTPAIDVAVRVLQAGNVEGIFPYLDHLREVAEECSRFAETEVRDFLIIAPGAKEDHTHSGMVALTEQVRSARSFTDFVVITYRDANTRKIYYFATAVEISLNAILERRQGSGRPKESVIHSTLPGATLMT